MTNTIDITPVFILFILMIFYALIYQRDEWTINKWYRYEYVKPKHKSLLELRKESVMNFEKIEEQESYERKCQIAGRTWHKRYEEETAPQSSPERSEGDANQ